MSDNPYERRPDENPYEQGGSQPGQPYGQSPGPQPYGATPPPPDAGAYGQPYGQPPAYGASPYGGTPYGMAPQPHPQGTTVLVLGIVGLVVCFIPGIVALVMGKRALREIDANPAAYNNRQNIQIGRILAIIGIVWQVGFGIIYGIVIAIAISAGSYNG